MSGVIKELTARHANAVVRSATPEAWETTAELRRQLLYTHLNALPARAGAAWQELHALKDKALAKQVTLGEAATFGLRCVEVYAFYCIGKMIGARSAQ
ncbi:hypothetical protein CDCA_CDCA09G2603 [Cyanidium caldarium]|uniref:Uncharacterized protein n=1 Tax=Cyanidium caldarium TaxID=2771 RepID=A0AAV9IWB2_CYACA|nr:hypothetical protein CDCA_CDCA09G2603 [Cyanidium caldarium]